MKITINGKPNEQVLKKFARELRRIVENNKLKIKPRKVIEF